jgi:hypothetical protein
MTRLDDDFDEIMKAVKAGTGARALKKKLDSKKGAASGDRTTVTKELHVVEQLVRRDVRSLERSRADEIADGVGYGATGTYVEHAFQRLQIWRTERETLARAADEAQAWLIKFVEYTDETAIWQILVKTKDVSAYVFFRSKIANELFDVVKEQFPELGDVKNWGHLKVGQITEELFDWLWAMTS